MLKHAPDFMQSYIDRYAKGAFTGQERSCMRDIRPQ